MPQIHLLLCEDILQALMVSIHLTSYSIKVVPLYLQTSGQKSQLLAPNHAWGNLAYVALTTKMHMLLLDPFASVHSLILSWMRHCRLQTLHFLQVWLILGLTRRTV